MRATHAVRTRIVFCCAGTCKRRAVVAGTRFGLVLPRPTSPVTLLLKWLGMQCSAFRHPCRTRTRVVAAHRRISCFEFVLHLKVQLRFSFAPRPKMRRRLRLSRARSDFSGMALLCTYHPSGLS